MSIDLVIRDGGNQVLLGLRNNNPAKDFYFVPGGRIWKNERLRDAFDRLLVRETNIRAPYESAEFLGVYEHFYTSNRFEEPDLGTHYVVLAYEVRPADLSTIKPDDQHRGYVWMSEQDLLASALVHDNTKAYFHARNDRTAAGKSNR